MLPLIVSIEMVPRPRDTLIMTKKLHVESTLSITVPTVQYGSMLMHSKVIIESDDESDTLEQLGKEANVAVRKNVEEQKTAMDEADANLFKMDKKLK